MFHKTRFLLFIMISGFMLVACQTSDTLIHPTTTILTTVPTNTPQPDKTNSGYPVPNHSFNIEEDGDTLSFENGSPIPAVAAFYKNQFLAKKCELASESGSSMDAVVMVFNKCEDSITLRIIIYAHPRNSGSVVTIAPDH